MTGTNADRVQLSGGGMCERQADAVSGEHRMLVFIRRLSRPCDQLRRAVNAEVQWLVDDTFNKRAIPVSD